MFFFQLAVVPVLLPGGRGFWSGVIRRDRGDDHVRLAGPEDNHGVACRFLVEVLMR